jgi:hypothetical protein
MFMRLAVVFSTASLLFACSSSRGLPPVETSNGVDAGIAANGPDAAVCDDAGPLDASDLAVVGSCSGAVTRSMKACVEWHAAGPYDFAWERHRECAGYTGTKWSDTGCSRLGPGGYCAFPFNGVSATCAETEWDYFYAGVIGADEVATQADACSQYGGTWTAF